MNEYEAAPNKFALALQEKGLPVISHGICQRCKEYILEDIRSADTTPLPITNPNINYK